MAPFHFRAVAAQSSVRSGLYGFKRTLKFFICTSIESILLLNQMVKYSSRTLNRTFALWPIPPAGVSWLIWRGAIDV